MPKNGKPRHTLTPMTELIAVPGSLSQPYAPVQDAEDVDQQVVEHAQAVVEDPQEVERGDHGGGNPRD